MPQSLVDALVPHIADMRDFRSAGCVFTWTIPPAESSTLQILCHNRPSMGSLGVPGNQTLHIPAGVFIVLRAPRGVSIAGRARKTAATPRPTQGTHRYVQYVMRLEYIVMFM